MTTGHLFKFSQIPPQEVTEAGTRTRASKENFPLLSGMSLYRLTLEPNGVREPHWHTNADELGYCIQGEVLISLYNTGDARATFLVQSGDVFFIPSGALHHVENVGKERAEIVLSFSNDTVEDFGLSGTLGEFTNNVLGNTWHVKGDLFNTLKRSTKNVFAALRKSDVNITEEARYQTPYRYHLEASQPILSAEGGEAKMARQNFWPILRRQALYSLVLTGTGMREPHWHPETSELGYVKKGKGRMSIMNPSGDVDTYIMEKGDVYFIPKAYPHHIENLEKEELQILVFFDQPMPGDVGFSGSIRSFSNEVLGAVTGTAPQFFDKLTKYYQDLFIVDKINPQD